MKAGEPKTGFDSTLRRALADDPAASGGASPGASLNQQECPSADLLAAYYERSLAANEAAQFDAHLAACSRCRSQLAVMARAEAPAKESAERSGASWWDWRWLVPAFATLTIALLWIGVHERSPFMSNKILVATNRNVPAAPLPSSTEARDSSAAPVPQAQGAPALPMPRGATRMGPAERNPTPPVLASGKNALTTNAATPSNKPQQESAGGAGAIEPGNSSANAPVLVFQGGAKKAAALSPIGGTSAQGQAGTVGGTVAKEAAPQQAPQNSEVDNVQATSTSITVEAQPATVPAAIPEPKAAPSSSATPHLASRATTMRAAPAAIPPSSNASAASSAITSNERQTTDLVEMKFAPFTIPVADSSDAWRISPSGSIEFSDDSGMTWVTQLAPPIQRPLVGYAPSRNICWIVGREGLILRTTNGTDWARVPSPTPLDLVHVRAADANHAIVTTADGTRYVTKNGGKSWKAQDSSK
jgi:Photosynthesis system II assembly factor YCF48/Putative zinc-finger